MPPRGPTLTAILAGLVFGTGAAGQTQFSFAPPVVLDIGFPEYPNSIDAGDLDEDGFNDLVVSGRNADGSFVLFFGSSTGFGPPVLQDLGGQSNWATFCDLNGDEHLDLAISHRQGLGRVCVFLGVGSRVLPAPAEYFAGRDPELIRAADLDADGDNDLAVFNWGSSDVSILRNDGTGAFTLAQSVRVNRTASFALSPAWAQIVDLDGDGDLDIAAASVSGTGMVHLLFNTGDGTFKSAVEQFVPGVGPGEAMATLAAADLDSDGDLDLVTKAGGLSFVDRFIVLANDGGGHFQAAGPIQLTTGLGGSPWDVAAVDLNGDLLPDLAWVTHAFSTQSLAMLRNTGAGVASFALPEQAIFLGGFPRALQPIDLDGDGDLDVVIANIGSHKVAIFENLLVNAAGAAPAAATKRVVRQDAKRLTKTGNGATEGQDAVAASGVAHVLASLANRGAPPSGPAVPLGAGAGACGDPESGSCIEPHATPGCANAECCAAICKQLPLCCFVEWDQACADAADSSCEQPACPSEGSCYLAHDHTGCDDQSCCELVCSVDAFCCGGPWDAMCAAEAAQLCAVSACQLPECPAAALPEDEAIECQLRTNDGCNLPVPAYTPISCGTTICGNAWAHLSRDTDWYQVTVDQPRQLAWTVTAEFPTEVYVVTGTCDDAYTVAASAFGSPCAPATARLPVQPGSYFLFVAPGTPAGALARGVPCLVDGKPTGDPVYTGRYFATLACVAPCAADLDGNGRVDILDFLKLIMAWGQSPGGPPDLDGDGTVGAVDFQILVGGWGPCG